MTIPTCGATSGHEEREPYMLEISLPGFAAGNVRHGSVKRVAFEVGEGAMADSLIQPFPPVGQRITLMRLADPVTTDDHVQGTPGAAVTLVQYGDYQCPYTRVSRYAEH